MVTLCRYTFEVGLDSLHLDTRGFDDVEYYINRVEDKLLFDSFSGALWII